MKYCQKFLKLAAYLVGCWTVMYVGYADQKSQTNNQATNGQALSSLQTNNLVLPGVITDSAFVATKATMDEVRDVIEDYQKCRNTRAAPKNYQTLVALGLWKVRTWKDAWGNVLQYECNGDRWTLRSAGADKKHGTEDDLVLRCEDGMNVTSIGFPTGNGWFLDSEVVKQNDSLRKKAKENAGCRKDGWSQIEIPDLLSVDIPPTLELQKGACKILKETVAKITLDLDLRSQSLTFQQTGLNAFDEEAFRRYARVIFKSYYNKDRLYDFTEEELTPDLLKLIEDDEYKKMKKSLAQANRIGESVKLIKWYPVKKVCMNGLFGYRVAVLRQSHEHPPVYVEEYKIGNGHYLHCAIFSYRQNEEAFWKEDYDEIKRRIKFTKECSIEKLALKGDADAQYSLGCRYAEGEGVPKDAMEAARWFRKAAEQGHVRAQFLLGCCYNEGEGVVEDKSEAFRWYHKAAEHGLAEAQFALGCCYDVGEGVEQDEKKAVRCFRNAAEQGFAKAQFNLSCCYSEGIGVAEDKKEAVRWCRKAAEQNLAEAQLALGACYSEGSGVDQDKKEAVRWYHKAAEQNLAEAQFYLAVQYFKGDGVVKDKSEAAHWWRKAAEQGHIQAQFMLGGCYIEGAGVDVDKNEGVRWLRKAANRGCRDAKTLLSRLSVPK